MLHGAAFGLSHWSFAKIYVVSFRIPHRVLSGPVGVERFHELHGLHCGFCTPGMLMTARALLNENPNPTEQEIRTAISGQICRCTGYKNIVSAVRWAAEHEAAMTSDSSAMKQEA